jgi:ketosteroid isomerase-like protein
MADIDARLQGLLDKQDIYEALLRYCRGVDRGDDAMIASAYHDDGIDDHGFWKGLGSDFAPFINDVLTKYRSTMHMINNVLIELDGDTAYVESYVESVHEVGDRYDTVHGRYLDRFERRNGQWKIAHRVVVRDLHRSDPVSPLYSAEEFGLRQPGMRGRSDPLYRLRDLGRR